MENKRAWIDTESGGTDPGQCALLQFSGLIEIDGLVVDTLDVEIAPFPFDLVDDQALKHNGIQRETLKDRTDPAEAFKKIQEFLCKHCDKYSKSDKYVMAGYRIGFDDSFLRKFWEKNGDKFYGSFFHNATIDVTTYVAELISMGLRLPNYKLKTICDHYGVSLINAHNAMADIVATRDLYYKCKAELK
jgi:DNA polymerase-3 subunit epsilon